MSGHTPRKARTQDNPPERDSANNVETSWRSPATIISIAALIVSAFTAFIAWMAVDEWRTQYIAGKKFDAAMAVLAGLDAFESNLRSARSKMDWGQPSLDDPRGFLSDKARRQKEAEAAVQALDVVRSDIVLLQANGLDQELGFKVDSLRGAGQQIAFAASYLQFTKGEFEDVVSKTYSADLYENIEKDAFWDGVKHTIAAIQLELNPLIRLDK